MMIKLSCKIPKTIAVACSGGPDSMAVLDFLRRGNRDIMVVHFDHGTDHSKNAKKFVEDYCMQNGIPLIIGSTVRKRHPTESPEEYWRNERMSFFKEIHLPIITGHNLDDAVEWWIFSTMNGNPQVMCHQNDKMNILRPFLTTEKEELKKWAHDKSVPYIEDPSNNNIRYKRNLIRHCVLPECMKVNPGLKKVIKKKLIKTANENHVGL